MLLGDQAPSSTDHRYLDDIPNDCRHLHRRFPCASITLMLSERQQALGAFYTPLPVAKLLVRWALGTQPGTVLDPSFGGCSFLRAAADHLETLGIVDTAKYVVGVDIDPAAQTHLGSLNSGAPRATGRIANFFLTRGSALPGAPFSAIVGNPPYIRHHRFGGQDRKLAQEAIAPSGVRVPQNANAWVYFVVHASAMLRKHGKLALILPGAVLHAMYARPLYPHIERHFSESRLIYLRSRIFEDTSQDSVILLASGYLAGTSTIQVSEISTISQLDVHIHNKTATSARSPIPREHKNALLSRQTSDILNSLRDNAFPRLDAIARVRIGVVTGANSFFLRSHAESLELRCPGTRFAPIIRRSAWLSGPTWTQESQSRIDSSGEKSQLLLVEPTAPLTGDLKRQIREAEAQGIPKRNKCRKRRPWYSLDDAAVPDAFLRYMSGSCFWIVGNRSRATATNAIHRIWWTRKGLPVASAIVGTWTSLFQLEAELLGRSYGSGVLKLEPSEAKKMRIPVHSQAGRSLPMLVRAAASDLQMAQDLADRLVLRAGLGFSEHQVAALRCSLDELKSRRKGSS